MTLRRSPTLLLVLGLALTLMAVGVFAAYSLSQLSALKRLQADNIDRNRKDSLQLLRMENDLNQVGLAMRDMSGPNPEYPIFSYEAQFQRHRADLEDAFRRERELAPAIRSDAQQLALQSTSDRLWAATGEAFALSAGSKEDEAQRVMRGRAQLQHRALTSLVSRFLIQNNELEEGAAQEMDEIYRRVEGNTYLFLGAMLLFITATSLSLIYFNNKQFVRMADLSEQKSVLAAKLISVQEEVLNSISRDLHDDFGQILTAVGAMLNRAQRKHPDSPMQEELREVRTVVQDTLQKIRSLSQALHPVVIDDYGLDRALAWYAQVFEKQHGIKTSYAASSGFPKVSGSVAMHAYRIAQEALSNIATHSNSQTAAVRLSRNGPRMRLEIEDEGQGFDPSVPRARTGLGLVAMRERTTIVGGTLKVTSESGQGTVITLEIPLPEDVPALNADEERHERSNQSIVGG
jgi:signal transduction histidine kinase